MQAIVEFSVAGNYLTRLPLLNAPLLWTLDVSDNFIESLSLAGTHQLVTLNARCAMCVLLPVSLELLAWRRSRGFVLN